MLTGKRDLLEPLRSLAVEQHDCESALASIFVILRHEVKLQLSALQRRFVSS